MTQGTNLYAEIQAALDRVRIREEGQAGDVVPVQRAWDRVWHDGSEQAHVTQHTSEQGVIFSRVLLARQGAHYTPVSSMSEYELYGIDGSAISLDRHEGCDWALLSTGTMYLHYGREHSSASTGTRYALLHRTEMCLDHDGANNATGCIDVRRTLCELSELERLAWTGEQRYVMFDGLLSYLYATAVVRGQATPLGKAVTQALTYARDRGICPLWYCSRPYSTDLARMLPNTGRSLVDSVLLSMLGGRESCYGFVRLHRDYDSCVDPLFLPWSLYLTYGDETARVEVPGWIVQEPKLRDRVVSVVFDQVRKGDGYPVCLAEAHAAAVLTRADQAQLYRMLEAAEGARMVPSGKSMAKRRVRL